VLTTCFLAPTLPDVPWPAVIVTSANGARGLSRLPGAARLAALPLYAVGHATATAARELGFADVRAAGGDADSLAELLGARLQPGDPPLIYAAGRQRKPTLEARLATAGFPLRVIEVYETRSASKLAEAARNGLASGAIQAALHFSRRSTEAFLAAAAASEVLPNALSIRNLAISADAAEPLAQAGASLIAVAVRPTLQSMIERLGDEKAWRTAARVGYAAACGESEEEP
jgi:uroporphyrinogen-III synthase